MSAGSTDLFLHMLIHISGIFEAGLLPGIAYYLSRWYRRAELTLRLGYYMLMTPLAGAFGGLLASGILSLDSLGSLTRWRMIFAIEGIITTGLGLIALVFLTDGPNTARWLTEEEKQLAIDRVKIERVGQSQVLDKLNKTRIKRGILNPATLSTAIVFLLNNVVALGIAFFLPTIIRTIYPGKTTVQLQLLSVPPYVVAAACLLTACYFSSRIDNRQIFLVAHGPLVLVGYAMLLSLSNPNARYAAVFLTASSIYIGGPFSNSQVSANTVSDTARNMGISINSKSSTSKSTEFMLKFFRRRRVSGRLGCDLDISPIRRSSISDRQRHQSRRHICHHSRHVKLLCLDEVRQRKAR